MLRNILRRNFAELFGRMPERPEGYDNFLLTENIDDLVKFVRWQIQIRKMTAQSYRRCAHWLWIGAALASSIATVLAGVDVTWKLITAAFAAVPAAIAAINNTFKPLARSSCHSDYAFDLENLYVEHLNNNMDIKELRSRLWDLRKKSIERFVTAGVFPAHLPSASVYVEGGRAGERREHQ